MGVVFAPETQYAKEMRKHEAWPTQFGPGERPYLFREFPKRLYKAERVQGKGIVITEAHTVNDDTEERNLQSRGFYFGQKAAIEAIEKEQLVHGTLAAEREWQIQHGRISDKATAEVRQAEEAHGSTHMPDVPEAPIKKRGRPKKETVS